MSLQHLASVLTGIASAALLHGLRLVAVAIVAQAVWGMARTLSRARARASITVASALIAPPSHSTLAQLGVIGLGAALGRRIRRAPLTRATVIRAVTIPGFKTRRSGRVGRLLGLAGYTASAGVGRFRGRDCNSSTPFIVLEHGLRCRHVALPRLAGEGRCS